VANSETDFEYQLFFNDQFMSGTKGQGIPYIPGQVWSETQQAPEGIKTSLFMKNGFAFMQNWMANNVLKFATGNMEATVAIMATPEFKNPKLNDDFNTIMAQLFPTYILIMYIPIVYN
jgi:hypothetical protein